MKILLIELSMGLLLLTSFACSSTEPLNNIDPNTANTQIASATNQTIRKNDISTKLIDTNFAQQIAMALDLNKDGNVDATEAPIMLGSMNLQYIHNNDDSPFSGYLPTKPLAITQIVDYMVKGADLSIMGSKVSEKNRDKIASNLASILIRDSIGDGSKVYGYSTTVGYFTGKTTAMVRNMDSSLLTKRIIEQTTVGQGTVNGKPYQTSNGSITVLSSFVTIDGQYKVRLAFSDYSEFESGIQLFGSHKISDAASKIVK